VMYGYLSCSFKPWKWSSDGGGFKQHELY